MFVKFIATARVHANHLVKKWTGSVGLPINRWLSAVAKVSSMTLISRVSGFARDFLFASVFGASPWLESFVISFKFPSMFRRVLGEGMTSVIVPVFTDINDQTEQNQFIQSMLLLLLIATGLMWALIATYPVFFVKILASGFADDERLMMTARMLPWSFSYLLFIAWIALLSGVLNARGSFALPAAVPVGLNIGLFVCTWLVYLWHGSAMWLAYALVLSGIAQVGVMLWAVFRTGFRCQWPHVWHKGVKKVFVLLMAAWAGFAASQISVFIDTWLASWLPTGCIGWLYYSERIVYLPQGTIGVAMATVLLPTLSQSNVSNDQSTYDRTLASGLGVCMRVGVPVMILMFCLAEPLVWVIFGHGKFKASDVHAAAQSVRAMVCGLPFMMMNKLLVASYFAKTLVRYTVIATLISVIVNTVIAVTLMHSLFHVAFAIGIAVGSLVSVVYLLAVHPSGKPIVESLKKQALADGVWWTLLLVLFIAMMFIEINASHGFIEKAWRLVIMISIPFVISTVLMKWFEKRNTITYISRS